MLDHLTKKPGEFRATCRTGARLPLDQLTPEERLDLDRRIAETEARGEYVGHLQSWDRKLRVEVALIECSLNTTDRDEYLAHMARFHGKKPTLNIDLSGSNLDLVRRASGRWATPKAKPEGTPVKPSTKEIEAALSTCGRCGLVAELGWAQADRLWWNEHLELCAGAETSAA